MTAGTGDETSSLAWTLAAVAILLLLAGFILRRGLP
jgi:LPXTG-motif cell wall-anchored protein